MSKIVIPDKLARDTHLSPTAKGLYIELACVQQNSHDNIGKAVKELVNHDYIADLKPKNSDSTPLDGGMNTFKNHNNNTFGNHNNK